MSDRPRNKQVFKVIKDLKIEKNQNVTIEGAATSMPGVLKEGQTVQVYKSTPGHTHVVIRRESRTGDTLILKVNNDVWAPHFKNVHLEYTAPKVTALQ